MTEAWRLPQAGPALPPEATGPDSLDEAVPGLETVETDPVFESRRPVESSATSDWARRIELRLERIEASLGAERGARAHPVEFGEVLHRFYKALDRLDGHVQLASGREASVEAHLREALSKTLAAAVPALEAARVGPETDISGRLDALEARMVSIDDGLRDLAQRPAPDPRLGEEVAGVRRRLSEDLTRRTEALHRRIELLSAGTARAGRTPDAGEQPDMRKRLDGIEAKLASLTGELDGLVPGLESGLRNALAEFLASQVREASSVAPTEGLHANLNN